MNKICLILAFISFNTSVIAQPLFNPMVLDTIKELDVAVVTGQYKPGSVKNSVYQVRVITKERIEKMGASKLQDVLNTELQLRFSQDIATGGSDISLSGLKGQNVKILLDGVPMIGRQGTSNEININQVDINIVERIEIVEGPMSVIYGADALAGVINIITRKPARPNFSVTARIQEETVGREYGWSQGIHNQYAGFSWKNKSWEGGGGIGRNYFGGWKDGAEDRELAWHKKDQLTAHGVIGYKQSGLNLSYRIDGLDEIITNPGNFLYRQVDADDTLAKDAEYLTKRVMQQLQGGYVVNNNLSFQMQSSYTFYDRQVFSTTISRKTGDRRLDLDPGTQSNIDFRGFSIRTTALYKISKDITIQPGVEINNEAGEGERLGAGKNTVSDHAFFITTELTPSPGISIRPGLRIAGNSVYKSPPLLPSLNAIFALSQTLDLRLAYAKGYRSPSLRELYFNFFDANHQIIGNPDLKAETSNSFTGSLSWKIVARSRLSFNTVLSGFYNNVKDLIDFAVSARDPNVFIYMNIAKYKTRGITLTGSANYNNWNAAAGISYTGYYNEFAENDPAMPAFHWSPEMNATLGYTFVKCGLDMNLFYKFTGTTPGYVVMGPDLVMAKQKSYQLADLTIKKKLCDNLGLTLGARNLFDVTRVERNVTTAGVHTTNGIRNIGYGRSFFAGLVFQWEKNRKERGQ